MSNLIIKTEHLNFSFGSQKTLQDVNLAVEEGSVYGFLGPNGAGKTTTLRLLLGLLQKQEGSIELFGQELAQHRINILKKTGSLIEQPSLYAHLTAKENLEVYRRIYEAKKERIEEVLKLVGLEDTASKKVKQFSLGMKQRLAVAVALLPSPRLLILDEPTNGLDPNGIVETRELIKKLNRESGVTILVSSHILAEIERMATHVGIIHKGKFLFQGELAELQHLQTRGTGLQVATADNKAAAGVLHSYKPLIKGDHLVLPVNAKEDIAAVNRLLTANGIDVYLLQPQQNDLEQLFMDITSGTL